MTAAQASTVFWSGLTVALLLILIVCVCEAVRATDRYLRSKAARKASIPTLTPTKGPTP